MPASFSACYMLRSRKRHGLYSQAQTLKRIYDLLDPDLQPSAQLGILTAEASLSSLDMAHPTRRSDLPCSSINNPFCEHECIHPEWLHPEACSENWVMFDEQRRSLRRPVSPLVCCVEGQQL